MNLFQAYRIHLNDGHIEPGFEELTLDDLTPGEVVIKSVYSGVNYKDALAACGKGKILRKFPLVGGIDVSGIVQSSEISGFKKGDEVLVCGNGLSETRDGGFAEYVRVPGDSVILLPDGMSLFQAMAIGSAGFSAALALHQLQRNGQKPQLGKVVVSGASGGVGSYAIDLLSSCGYSVVAISGKTERVSYLKSLGATEVLSRQELNLGERPLEASLWAGAVDCVGGKLLSWLTRTVQPLGNIAAIGLTGGIEINTTVMPFILRGINLLGINSVVCPYKLKQQIWQRLATDLTPRHIDKIVTSIIEFNQLPKVFPAYIKGKVTGRTVVKFANK